MNRKTLIGTALATMLLAAGIAQADSERDDARAPDPAEVKVSMQQAIDAAERHTGGKAMEAELEHEDGAARYEIRTRTDDGMHEVYVSASDASILPGDEKRKNRSED